MKLLIMVLAGMLMLACSSTSPAVRSSPLPADPPDASSAPWEHGALGVASDGRYLVHADGTPFFWLGDTAWDLFHRFTREEAAIYLDRRRQQGFTVIQASFFAPMHPISLANPYGDAPFIDNDPTRPDVTDGSDPNDERQYDFWDQVDYIFTLAEQRGLYIAALPAWAYHATDGTPAFTTGNARAYGRYVAERYGQRPNVIWVLGGDRFVVWRDVNYSPLWREMATGIETVAGTGALITYHPGDSVSSSKWLHDAAWLDMNLFQSGHGTRDRDSWALAAADYARTPPKPTLDGESNYEDHPVNWKPEQGYFRDYDVRKQAYRAVFAGAAGHTYGHHSVWQKYQPGTPGIYAPEAAMSWIEALDRPGAAQMIHLRRLVESRPYLSRIPDQALLASEPGDPRQHVRATRSSFGSYAMVYIPTAEQTVTVKMTAISGGVARAWWYDPRTGEAAVIGEFPTEGVRSFQTPARGPDWVLVLDDRGRGFPAPGVGTLRP